jgi:hypothetical protein
MGSLQSSLRHVMSAIENLRDDLRGLSDTIWTSIDHNDPKRLEEGYRFKQAFNERWLTLDEAAEALWQLLKEEQGEAPAPTPPRPTAEPKPKGRGGKDRPADDQAPEAPADQSAPGARSEAAASLSESQAAVDEDLKGKTPFGFILEGRTFTSPGNWVSFYQMLLQELAKQYPEAFERLPERKAWRDQQGRPLFGRTPEALRRPLEVTEGLHAEADLPLGPMLQAMRQLTRELKLTPDDLKILLKEDRRGTVETRPLAA